MVPSFLVPSATSYNGGEFRRGELHYFVNLLSLKGVHNFLEFSLIDFATSTGDNTFNIAWAFESRLIRVG